MSLWVESMNRRDSTRRACSGARLGSRLRQAHHIRSALGKRWESKPSLTYSLSRSFAASLSLSLCWLIVSIALGQLLDKLLALCVGAAGSTCVMRGRPTPRRRSWFYLYFYVNLLLQILLLPLSSGNTLEMLPPTPRYQLDVITTATTTCNSFF